MFRLMQITLPGVLFFLIVLEYKQVERLRTENAQLRSRLAAFEGGPDNQLKTALQLASQGKSSEALSRLKNVSKEAQEKARALEEQAAKARSAENARRAAQRNKKDLEQMLDMSPAAAGPRKPAPRKELRVSGCKALEVESNKFAGHRITITDKVEQLDNFYSFSDCSGIRIAFDRMDEDTFASLRSKLAGKDSARVTFSGEYSGLVFYPDKLK